MDREHLRAPSEEASEATDDVSSLRTDGEGMGVDTARLVIDKKLRSKIMQEYDLVEVENKGRYYVAKAFSKDGIWLYELLVDKQSGNIQVVNRIKRGTERPRRK